MNLIEPLKDITHHTEDEECLDCHGENNDPDAPRTTHQGFHGCLKCHNDNVNSTKS